MKGKFITIKSFSNWGAFIQIVGEEYLNPYLKILLISIYSPTFVKKIKKFNQPTFNFSSS